VYGRDNPRNFDGLSGGSRGIMARTAAGLFPNAAMKMTGPGRRHCRRRVRPVEGDRHGHLDPNERCSPEGASRRLAGLVLNGGASPAWMGRARRAVASAIPAAVHRMLEGQPHYVAPEAVVPELLEFLVTS
jgi:hypothetical protein